MKIYLISRPISRSRIKINKRFPTENLLKTSRFDKMRIIFTAAIGYIYVLLVHLHTQLLCAPAHIVIVKSRKMYRSPRPALSSHWPQFHIDRFSMHSPFHIVEPSSFPQLSPRLYIVLDAYPSNIYIPHSLRIITVFRTAGPPFLKVNSLLGVRMHQLSCCLCTGSPCGTP